VFDDVNAITIQGLETRPTDSFALLVLSILVLLLFSSGCPVLSCGCHAVSCAVLQSLQKVQGHRTAQGHRAGVDVDVTPPTRGPVGHPPQSGDPV